MRTDSLPTRTFLALTAITLTLALILPACDSEKQLIGNDPPISDTTPFKAADFSPATSCQGCHPKQYKEWSGSMHAYAMIDPSFAAIREVGQSAYVNALDGACTQCHSPIGKRSGDIAWGPYDLADLDPVTQEGVGCDLCHTITSISRLSNGGVDFAPSDIKYGNIKEPISNPFHQSEYHPLYGTSELCGSCHDFITDDGLDLETTFREWRGKGLVTTGKECVDCHMPSYSGSAANGGPQRTLHSHTFVGADLALIDFPEKAEQFQLVTAMLQSALTMNVSVPGSATAGGQLDISVDITNDKTGHNVPSGVPFNRQVWLSILVRDNSQNIVYSSGQLDANLDLMDDHSEFAARDTDLFNAQATMYRADSSLAAGTWDVAYMTNPSIEPGETRTVDYTIPVPPGLTGNLSVDVTLRFRSFPPYLFRSLGLDSLLPIPIIDMATSARTVTLQ